MTLQFIEPGARMSQAVIYGNTVYLAGQVAADPSTDMSDQTRQTLAQIDELLQRAGTDKHHLISAQVWVSDMTEFAAMNEVWDAWVSPQRPPVRAAVQAVLAKPEWKVEMMVIGRSAGELICGCFLLQISPGLSNGNLLSSGWRKPFSKVSSVPQDTTTPLIAPPAKPPYC